MKYFEERILSLRLDARRRRVVPTFWKYIEFVTIYAVSIIRYAICRLTPQAKR
jgi:hypothetical protein